MLSLCSSHWEILNGWRLVGREGVGEQNHIGYRGQWFYRFALGGAFGNGERGTVVIAVASKLFCEKLVSVWAEKNSCRYAILRYGHIFGPGEESYGKVIPLMIRRLLAGEVPNVHGAGLAERDLLYVKDAVEATVRAACSRESIEPVNIVGGVSTSIGEIAKLLIEKTGMQVQTNFLTDKPDGHSFRFDNTMMRRTLGDWPLVSLSDGLEEEVSVFRRLVDVG